MPDYAMNPFSALTTAGLVILADALTDYCATLRTDPDTQITQGEDDYLDRINGTPQCGHYLTARDLRNNARKTLQRRP